MVHVLGGMFFGAPIIGFREVQLEDILGDDFFAERYTLGPRIEASVYCSKLE